MWRSGTRYSPANAPASSRSSKPETILPFEYLFGQFFEIAKFAK
jgi:hypothetical protein